MVMTVPTQKALVVFFGQESPWLWEILSKFSLQPGWVVYPVAASVEQQQKVSRALDLLPDIVKETVSPKAIHVHNAAALKQLFAEIPVPVAALGIILSR
jgi:hypothetical protein